MIKHFTLTFVSEFSALFYAAFVLKDLARVRILSILSFAIHAVRMHILPFLISCFIADSEYDFKTSISFNFVVNAIILPFSTTGFHSNISVFLAESQARFSKTPTATPGTLQYTLLKRFIKRAVNSLGEHDSFLSLFDISCPSHSILFTV